MALCGKNLQVKLVDFRVGFQIRCLLVGFPLSTLLSKPIRSFLDKSGKIKAALLQGVGGYFLSGTLLICTVDNASINVKPKGGDPRHMWGIDFSEEFLVKTPTVGPPNLVKSNQISPT